MINWKELEKFIAPGKVMTLVIVVDGQEIGALSFNIDSLAYKAVLETVSHVQPVVIPDKPKKAVEKEAPKKSEITVQKPKPEPEPMDDDEPEEEEEENEEVEDESHVDFTKQEIKKPVVEDIPVKKPLTREAVLSQPAPVVQKSVEEQKIEAHNKKVEKNTSLFDDEW